MFSGANHLSKMEKLESSLVKMMKDLMYELSVGQ